MQTHVKGCMQHTLATLAAARHGKVSAHPLPRVAEGLPCITLQKSCTQLFSYIFHKCISQIHTLHLYLQLIIACCTLDQLSSANSRPDELVKRRLCKANSCVGDCSVCAGSMCVCVCSLCVCVGAPYALAMLLARCAFHRKLIRLSLRAASASAQRTMVSVRYNGRRLIINNVKHVAKF